MEDEAISAFFKVEVEVEAELGKSIFSYLRILSIFLSFLNIYDLKMNNYSKKIPINKLGEEHVLFSFIVHREPLTKQVLLPLEVQDHLGQCVRLFLSHDNGQNPCDLVRARFELSPLIIRETWCRFHT